MRLKTLNTYCTPERIHTDSKNNKNGQNAQAKTQLKHLSLYLGRLTKHIKILSSEIRIPCSARHWSLQLKQRHKVYGV